MCSLQNTLAMSLQKSFRESGIYVLRTLLLLMERLSCSSVVTLLRGEELGLNLSLALSPSSNCCSLGCLHYYYDTANFASWGSVMKDTTMCRDHMRADYVVQGKTQPFFNLIFRFGLVLNLIKPLLAPHKHDHVISTMFFHK